MANNDHAGAIRVVEVASGAEIARLTSPDSHQHAPVAFTPDGGTLITIRSDTKAICAWDLRMIRARLKELGLDWDWPEFPAANATDSSTVQVEIDMGDLSQPGPHNEAMTRRAIERYRGNLKSNPDSAADNNALAWTLVAGPIALRDVKTAIGLAEKAVRLVPSSALFANTLGVVYYRDGQFQRAIEVLRPNLERGDDMSLPFDLFFLAMAHAQLGEADRARDYYDWALRWTQSRPAQFQQHIDELKAFRAEAEKLMRPAPAQRD
jgi:tetratricopeptide (TPR) repeat protein